MLECPSFSQIYTQFAIRKLEEIHTATHPASKLGGEGLPEELLEELREATLEDAEGVDGVGDLDE